jgi:hypothetical protein
MNHTNPPSELVLFDDAYNNLTACYEERSIESAIGGWMLPDRATKEFSYAYLNSIRNTTEQSSYYNDNGLINMSAFLPYTLLLLVMIVLLSHVLHFFFRHLGQSRFISQIIVWNLTTSISFPSKEKIHIRNL